MAFQPVENYGVIGNIKSIALVGHERFYRLSLLDVDSPTVLLRCSTKSKEADFRSSRNSPDMRIRQPYLPDANILLTRFLAEKEWPS
jgi:hypothetical protein